MRIIVAEVICRNDFVLGTVPEQCHSILCPLCLTVSDLLFPVSVGGLPFAVARQAAQSVAGSRPQTSGSCGLLLGPFFGKLYIATPAAAVYETDHPRHFR